MVRKVAIQYDKAEDIEKQLAEWAEKVEDLIQKLRRQQSTLQAGGWRGRGSDAFYEEMDNLCFPALVKLTDALEETSKGVRKSIDIFKEAEQRGSKLFKGGVEPVLRGPNYFGFISKLFSAFNKGFPNLVKKITNKLVELGKSILPKLFSGGGGGGTGILGKLGKIAQKIPLVSIVFGIGGGLYEHFTSPPEQRTWKNFFTQVGSGALQGVVNSTPIGWIDLGTQLLGGGAQIIAERLGASPETVDNIRDLTDMVSFDNLFDKSVSAVIESPSSLFGIGGRAYEGVNQWMNLPEDQRTTKNLAVQTISSFLQPNQAVYINTMEYIAEYQAKFNNQDPQAAIDQARREATNFHNMMDTKIDQVVSNAVDTVSDMFSGAMQRFGL